MNSMTARLSPTITNMIRLDHTHVFSTFHQYKPGAPVRVRKGLADTICTALEIHAQLEEEIFYPAMREVTPEGEIGRSEEEHAEMKRLILVLRTQEPEQPEHEQTLLQLMRAVLHHVADEETVVLPQAEHALADRLQELGAAMTKRRMQLVLPRTGEIALSMGRAASGNKVLIAAVCGLALGGLALARRRPMLRMP
jgi:iron-sulfur cluster repair protein YtfE (RIC family)